MENYADLVSIILKNESLSKATKDLMDDNVLNLVVNDWELQLKNNVSYQNYCSPKPKTKLWNKTYEGQFYEYESSHLNDFQVIVAGHCKFVKPYQGKNNKPGIIITQSEPLSKIFTAMTVDIEDEFEIPKELKFNFLECSPLTCEDCSVVSKEFAKNGFKITRMTQPCIADTKVYDGKQVVNRFQSHLQSMFNQSFLAVVLLNINTRYRYIDKITKQKCYRISGNVLNMIAFTESKLIQDVKKINLGQVGFVDLSLADNKMVDKKFINNEPSSADDLESYMREDMKDYQNEQIDNKCGTTENFEQFWANVKQVQKRKSPIMDDQFENDNFKKMKFEPLEEAEEEELFLE